MAEHNRLSVANGYIWYLAGLVILSILIIAFSIVIWYLGEAVLSFSVALGALISGFVGLLALIVQDLQYKSRGAKVYFHIWNAPHYLNKVSGKKTYPLILRNQGSLPGKGVQCFLTIKANKGRYNFTNPEKWTDETDIQGGFETQNTDDKKNKIFSRMPNGPLYPKAATGEYYIGFIEIEPDSNGVYDIDVEGEVQESFGVSKRICKLSSDNEGNRNPCGPENNYKSYY